MTLHIITILGCVSLHKLNLSKKREKPLKMPVKTAAGYSNYNTNALNSGCIQMLNWKLRNEGGCHEGCFMTPQAGTSLPTIKKAEIKQ